MQPRDRIVRDVRQLLEQKYLESNGDQCKQEYAGLSETEKMEVLKVFLQKRTAGSKAAQWAKVLQDILQADHSPAPPY
jgi:vacuolar-type H+-ATPase catalytic subunit A/Vma1